MRRVRLPPVTPHNDSRRVADGITANCQRPYEARWRKVKEPAYRMKSEREAMKRMTIYGLLGLLFLLLVFGRDWR